MTVRALKPIERTMLVHKDIFDAALEDASRTLCEGLGLDYGDAALSFWQTQEGTEARSVLKRFAAHMLIHSAEGAR
jgi:hypothetical protein